MNSYSNTIKESVINRYKSGDSVTQLSKSTEISRSTIYSWIKTDVVSTSKKVDMGEYQKLKSHYKKLKNIIEILKKSSCLVSAPLSERYQVIESLSNEYNINTDSELVYQ